MFLDWVILFSCGNDCEVQFQLKVLCSAIVHVSVKLVSLSVDNLPPQQKIWKNLQDQLMKMTLY